ncbi:MAG: bifunctional [glutamate--ammonia ligase]-adenylyl-L-tyrosine phosphorylase/[glutamate--ammonia-ligase] adenylyltransferase [Pseudomonadota bacterium]|nr:bifunctional [glutamate--ammonia ligase]-adenylyl-L-tyrosine phosphorylase/[glutamate--ammonia-ligase] adenylyltransferase [Pseudomonadota bacterium]
MDLDRALSFSHYAEHALLAQAALRDELVATLDAPFDWTKTMAAVDAVVAGGDAGALAAALRVLRRHLFLHTLARDLTGRAPFGEVVQAMTTLAERALRAAVDLHTRALTERHGIPLGETSGAPQRLIVVGMGKLGGRELNVSSDVDLVFVYPEEGETAGPTRISNREFFDRLGQRIVAALGRVDADGYVFRVDTRLRPYGASGPLTVSFGALEQYLVTQGRTWERYAWLKARALTGECHDGLAELVTPFVYRKYLDYDAYEGLRGIHRQIRDQEKRRDYANDIKLGAGGIREIEFIVQALQIVRGGRDPALRLQGTVPALAALAERQLIAPHAATVLHDGYLFLRALEHRLQYRDDRQTQRLPSEAGERALVAEALDFASSSDFDNALLRHRDQVARQFNAVFDAPDDAASNADPPNRYVALWDDPQSTPEMLAELEAAGFDAPAELVHALLRMRESRRYLQLPALSRDRFDRLVPALIAVAAEHPGAGAPPAAVLQRLLGLLEAVSGRSAYLALLIEHPPLLPRLAQLMGASAWAADYLTRRPLLLDELLDARVLLAEPDWNGWRTELDRLLVPHAQDAEAAMDTLRHFQHAQTFRLLAQDLAGQTTVERLADHLSALADTILSATLSRCWSQLHGTEPPHFAIIGYGKLGGKELGYASDLDLVFLYDADPARSGDDVAPERYARLAQRINTWLTSATGAGRLYETDLRLRPDGAAGLLVSSIRAFERYQREQAWTWERQALTRARFVAGDPRVGAAFEATREGVLRLSRERARLAGDIIDMRSRMAAEHVNRTPLFDLKHDPGGMVDIEFAVQFLVLAFAHSHPELTRNAGNIALLEIAADAALLPRALALEAADAYREYRRLQHRVRLTGAAHARVEPLPQAERRASVDALWAAVFGAARETQDRR